MPQACDNGGLKGADICNFGSDPSYVVRARLTAASEATGDAGTEAVTAAVGHALDQSVGPGQYTISRHEAVGPKVGRELQGKAFMAILLSFVVTLIYLAFRFEWRFGPPPPPAAAHGRVATPALIPLMHPPGSPL